MKQELWENILNSGRKLVKENSVSDLIKKYKDNPYSIGANAIEVDDNFIILRFDNENSRKKSMQQIQKEFGIHFNKMILKKAEKGFSYRYELSIRK